MVPALVAAGLLAGTAAAAERQDAPFRLKPIVQANTPAARAVAAARAANDAPSSLWAGHLASVQAGRFVQWLVSIPVSVSPLFDDGTNCALNQAGPVWYLAGSAAVFTVDCTMPAGKFIVAPVVATWNDYPCPDPTFVPAPGQSLFEFLRIGAASLIDTVTTTDARLDGRPVRVQRLKSPAVFPFLAAVDWKGLDACVTGSPQVAVADGYFVLLDPLPRGDHVLEVRSTGPLTGDSVGTYRLRVQ